MLTDLLLRSDPFSDMDELFRRLEPHAGRGLDGRHGLALAGRRAWPAVTVTEAEGAFDLTADVPGLAPEALDVAFEGGVLTIRGRFDDVTAEEGRVVRTERVRTTFERSFRFGRPVDEEAIEATLTDGVLRVHVPLRKLAARTIPVQDA